MATHGTTPASRRRWLFRFLLAAIVLALLVVIAELSLRVFWQVPPAFGAFDAAAMWCEPAPGAFELRAGTWRMIREAEPTDPPPPAGFTPPELRTSVNAQGLRGPELDAKQAGETRLLFCGDSLTFGLGIEVEDCFAHLTATLLRQRGVAAVACNAAMPGYGFAATCDRLGRLRERTEADALIAAYFLGNDFTDDIAQRTTIVVGGRMFDGPAGNLLRTTGRARMCVHSRLALFVEAWLMEHRQQWSLLPAFRGTPEQAALAATLPANCKIGGLYLDASEGHAFQPGSGAVVAAWLADLEVSLSRLQRHAGGLPVLVVILPTQFHLDHDLRAKELAATQLDANLLTLGSSQRRMLELCARLRVPCLDATPALAAGGSPGSLYDRDHIHLSKHGNRVIAEGIAQHLEPVLRR